MSEQDAIRLIDEGHGLEERGLIDQAMKCYQEAIRLNPNFARAHLNYGNALLAKQDLDGALHAYKKALEFKPDYAGAYFNLGNALLGKGKYDEAIRYYADALKIQPDYAEVHCCLGIARKELGQLDDAVASYQTALKINPKLSEAHINLGNVLQSRSNLKEAAESYRRALEIVPDKAASHIDLGHVLHKLGHMDEAIASFRRALAIDPDNAHVLNLLATLLIGRGEPDEVVGLIMRSIKVEDKPETRALFVNCAKRVQLSQPNHDFRDILIRAMTEPWCRPKTLGKSAAHHIKQNPAVRSCVERAKQAWPKRLLAQELFGPGEFSAVATDPLLHTLLCSIPINDIDIERFLTMVRRTMLEAASTQEASEVMGDKTLMFYIGIAQQCFNNEYVYAQTDDEAILAHALHDRLVGRLEAGSMVPILMLVTVASYIPLYSIQSANSLLDRTWPAPVKAILTQQIREPEEEQQYCANLPRLTPIENEVSVLVRNQYEANPYPRWIKTDPPCTPVTVEAYLRQRFPLAPFKPLSQRTSSEILIAGCGTGQQVVGTAQLLQGIQMLAIDLSLSSLSYAKRKTRELGLTNIEFAQADLLRLGTLERNFDIIESGGVLHHLADPWTGWRVLLSLLRPGGLMKLGFYSEIARRGIVQLRDFIAEHGYGSTVDEIRECRQVLVDREDSSNFRTVLESPDFFSTSACRDLLFHVQEHRMTLTGIDTFLRENDLTFIGFEIENDVISAYQQHFPEDRAAINLGLWNIFEQENPDTFVGMYQFWIQKSG